MATKLPRDFKEFLKLLDKHGVEYLLIGGYAVGYYGYPRPTSDMDVWIAMHWDNASRITAAIREFGFSTPDLNEQLFMELGNIVRMGHPPMRLEILNAIDVCAPTIAPADVPRRYKAVQSGANIACSVLRVAARVRGRSDPKRLTSREWSRVRTWSSTIKPCLP